MLVSLLSLLSSCLTVVDVRAATGLIFFFFFVLGLTFVSCFSRLMPEHLVLVDFLEDFFEGRIQVVVASAADDADDADDGERVILRLVVLRVVEERHFLGS